MSAPRLEGVRLGLRANWRQFALLVVVNAFVGGMVGLERAVLPLLAEHDFGLASRTAILAFIVSFGLVKALKLGSLALWPLAGSLGGGNQASSQQAPRVQQFQIGVRALLIAGLRHRQQLLRAVQASRPKRLDRLGGLGERTECGIHL